MKHHEPVVYLDGRFLSRSAARISVDDRGFLYGHALFETVRAYAGVLFAFDLHLERLTASAARVDLRLPLSRRRLADICLRLLERNRFQKGDAALRITLTRGAGGEGLVPPARLRPTLLITARPLDPELPELRRKGVRVILLPFHRATDAFSAGVKTVDYLSAVVGKTMARRGGAFEGIYTSAEGESFEGTTSNLFLVRGRRLLTPPATRGVLPGVTRSLALRLARELGLTVVERKVTAARLREADEAFLTASTIEILPIRSIDGMRRFGPPGPQTRLMQAGYANLVQRFALLRAKGHFLSAGVLELK